MGGGRASSYAFCIFFWKFFNVLQCFTQFHCQWQLLVVAQPLLGQMILLQVKTSALINQEMNYSSARDLQDGAWEDLDWFYLLLLTFESSRRLWRHCQFELRMTFKRLRGTDWTDWFHKLFWQLGNILILTT